MTKNAGDKHYEKIQEQVIDWLRLEKYEVVKTSSPSALWFVATHQNALGMGIGQKIDRPEKVLVSATMKLADWQDSKINGLEEPERGEFLWDLRFRLLGLDVDFGGVDFPLREVVIFKDLFADSLNRSSLLAAVRAVRNGLLTVTWSIQRRAGGPLDKLPVN